MAFREQVQRQASRRRREMVRTGVLLARREFLALLGVDEMQLTSLIAAGSVFSVEVENVPYFPAVLGDPTRDRARLHAICRILLPAPSACRLDYLESRQANLGDISPLDALGDEKRYRSLRRLARAWAAGWSRTLVKLYIGSYLEEPDEVEPAYTAVDEVDPRTDLWKRAVGALQAGGYVGPSGPQPLGHVATIFVSQVPAGDRPPAREARIVLRVARHLAHVEVFASGSTRGELSVPLAGTEKNIVDIVLRCVERIRLVSVKAGQGGRIGRPRVTDDRMLSTEEAAKVLNVSRPYVIKLADSGKLGVVERTQGSGRRIPAAAVHAYRRQRQTESREAMQELAAVSQGAALYDADSENGSKDN